MQAIEAKVQVVIPEEFVLITKVEYKSLKENEQKGEIGDMKWFKSLVGIASDATVKEKILYPYREELEPFIKYADGGQSHWRFHKNQTRDWIERNFDKVVGR